MTVTIDHLGHRGDGIARTERGQVFVPRTLPDETVRASVSGERGTLLEILTPSHARVSPFCPVFDTCGGCTSQHVEGGAYALWKRGIVEIALRNRGIEAEVDPLIDAHGAGRRRATFHARKAGGSWIIGYSEARSHHVVAIESCPILVDDLSGASALIRTLADALGNATRFDVQLTRADNGIDVYITGAGALDLPARTGLAEAAHRLNLLRIAVEDETIAVRIAPRINMGTAAVVPPAGVFLQATAAGERVLGELVCGHLGTASRIVDLFSGLGPFALRLAAHGAVEAFDSDNLAIAALNSAINAAKLHNVKASIRDLFTRPLHVSELDRFDGAVFDPPRAGAEAQARMLAVSKIPLVCAVSCDPATFARDAAILISGGYRLDRVTPVDQFKWSPHVEIVATFHKN